MGRGWPLYAGGGEDSPKVCRDCNRIDLVDAQADRGCPIHVDARFTFLIEKKMKEKISNNIQIKNKRATFDYELLDTFTAGIVLTGTEIKSIRLGKASLVDTFCIVEKGELWVKNMYVAEYFYGTYNNHTARRDRKLLLTKKELRKIESAARNNGFTIIPTRLFINDKGLAKVIVAIAKGKKEYDKRDSIKERDDRREMDRAFKRN